MAAKKNWDWTVPVSDIWYQISRPPGLFIAIIVVLAGALWFSRSSPPATTSSVQAPQVNSPTWSLPPAQDPKPNTLDPASPRYQTTPTDDPGLPPPSYCSSNQTWDERSKRCVLSAGGTQNNCPGDYIFVERLQTCISMTEHTSWFVDPGNSFYINGEGPTVITVTQGGLVAVTSIDPTKFSRTTFMSEGKSIRFKGRHYLSTSAGARFFVTYE